jgi:hypothetical protein
MASARGEMGAEGQRQQQRSNNGNAKTDTTASRPEWLKIVDDLIKLEGEIESITKQKTKDAIHRIIQKFQEVDTATQTRCEIVTALEKGFQKLEEKLTTKLEGSKGPAKGTTWADVAAAVAVPQPTTTAQTRPTVRIRIPETADKSAAELLARVKPIIPGAYAVKPLRSGDIEVVVPDQKTKDQVLNQKEVEGCKVLRQDYPVEVPSVPLSVTIKNRRDPENENTIREICRANKRMIPSLAINRVRWLHDDKTQEERRRNGKTRGTVIMSLPTQELQHEVIRKGIVIDSQIYDARLYSQSLEAKQCYKCSQWGHTQSACGKKARCGECAGPHETRDCPKQRVSCCNCGRGHRAWQKAQCKTFQAYWEDIQAKRVRLVAETAVIRRTESTQSVPYQFVGGKRGREEVPASGAAGPLPKRGPGRPPLVLAREGAQGRITNLFATASAAQATSSRASPVLRSSEPGTTQATALVLSQQDTPEPTDTPMEESTEPQSTNEW